MSLHETWAKWWSKDCTAVSVPEYKWRYSSLNHRISTGSTNFKSSWIAPLDPSSLLVNAPEPDLFNLENLNADAIQHPAVHTQGSCSWSIRPKLICLVVMSLLQWSSIPWSMFCQGYCWMLPVLPSETLEHQCSSSLPPYSSQQVPMQEWDQVE